MHRSIRSCARLFAALAVALVATRAAFAATDPSALVLPPLAGEAAAPFESVFGHRPEPVAAESARLTGAAPLRAAQPALVAAAAGFSFESNVSGRTLGQAATPVGDLNGDGYGDFAATGNVNSFNTALYLFFGSAAGPVLAPGYPVTNLPAGGDIAATGDVNNDGRDDLAMFWNANGNLRLYFGNASGVDLVSFNALNAFFPAGSAGLHGAPAGDVNGDNFADVIFGMPEYGGAFPCGASAFSGQAVVMYGSATGFTATNYWNVTGCYASGPGARLGASVAGAGDVNGDGFDDIVIGAPGMQAPGIGGVGYTYVLYGAAAGLPKLPGFTNLGAVTYGTTIVGHHVSGSFGTSVCAAGDLNADGYADIAVGAPGVDQYGTDAGFAIVFRGTSAGVDTSHANALWLESAGVPNAQFGRYVAPGGDVNGDGRPDLLVGEVSRVDLAQSSGSFLFILQTLPYGSGLRAVSAGDVNGDGMCDVLVGDPGFSNVESSEGRVLVHFGAGSPPSSTINWSVTQTAIDNPNLGWCVASAGDVNGDGYDDVLVGEPTWYNFIAGGSNNGLVQLFYGSASGLAASAAWFTYGNDEDQLGVTVMGADVNGDGWSDVLAGGHTANGNVGLVRVWYGSPSGPSNAGPNLTLNGPPTGGYFGAALAPAGDVNNDGYPDVVVGAPYAEDPVTPLTDEGRVYVFRGSAAGLVSTPLWTQSGLQANAHYGSSVGGAGDVNGDGYADIVAGAPDFDTANKLGTVFADAGLVRVVLGSPAGPYMNTQSSVFSAGWRYGASVAGAGDVNGDGFSDVIIGAPGGVNTLGGEGAARVVAGAAGGLGAALWTQYGGEAFGSFGSSVSSAGDVDGDGLSDVLVGAVFQDMGGPQDQGRAYVFRGPLPAGGSAFWTGSGGSAFANLGHVVASAGDVNGDGWNDLVFGLPGFDGSGWRQGVARAYYGAQAGGTLQLGLTYHLTAPGHIVHPGCLGDPGGVALLSTLRSAAGRGKVRLQYRLTPPVTLPAASVAAMSPYAATGNPGANGSVGAAILPVGGLTAGVPYAFTMRSLARNVYYPTGPWRSHARSGRLEADFRVPGNFLDATAEPPRAVLELADVRPNPMRASTAVVFSLARAGRVSLAVHDLQGRRVRTLADGALAAGDHRLTWDGGLDDGGSAASGVYLVRLEADGRVLSRKVVRVR